MEPRDPTAEEVALLRLLLPVGAFPDVDVYRAQVDHLKVTGKCGCGCPTIYLTVDESQARRAGLHGDPLLPVEAEAGDPTLPVELMLFARDGWLTTLELVSYDGKPPRSFAPLADWRVKSPSSGWKPAAQRPDGNATSHS